MGKVYSSNQTPTRASPGLLPTTASPRPPDGRPGEHESRRILVSVPWARWHGSMSGDERVHTHGHRHKRPPPREVSTDV